MSLITFYFRSIVFHWRIHLAATLAVIAGATALTGSLVVGDSMRGSLRELALGRLGRVDHALVAGRFFRESLASKMADAPVFGEKYEHCCPIILIRGGIHHADSQVRVNNVNVLGVDHRFWRLSSTGQDAAQTPVRSRSIILSEPLAAKLGARPGDDLLVRIAKPSSIPIETLLGRRDDATISLRLTVSEVIPPEDLGNFSLNSTQYTPLNAYVLLTTLQRVLEQHDRVNVMLVAGKFGASSQQQADVEPLQYLLDRCIELQDLDLKLRRDDKRNYVALESDGGLINPVIESAAFEAANAVGSTVSPVLTYLANNIAVEPPKSDDSQGDTPADSHRQIPYSTVSAIGSEFDSDKAGLRLIDGRPAPVLKDAEILLNEWAADDLQVRPGDRICLTYYVVGPFGQLQTAGAAFVLRGIVALQMLADDPGLTPEYRGITDAKNLSNWNPPFPIDLKRIRDQDEQYWDNYGPTPKAFVSLQTGQRLWAHSRFGRLTSMRLSPAKGEDLQSTAQVFERELLNRLTGKKMGLVFEPVKTQALAASKGGTDFGMLFICFSFFLIASAAALVALVFRLGVERRSAEVGILLALGFEPKMVSGLLLAEGVLLAVIGSAIGLISAIGYARLMLAGLQSWWSGTVQTQFLQLHVSATSLATGFTLGTVIGLLSIVWAFRGLSRISTSLLLSGEVSSAAGVNAIHRKRGPLIVAGVSLIVAAGLIGVSWSSGVIPATPAFFASGAALLVACLAGLILCTRHTPGPHYYLTGGKKAAITRLGIRNAARSERRSLLTVGLIASATFIIVTVGLNRHDAGRNVLSKQSPTGGFKLLGQSTVPILYDLNTNTGRNNLNLKTSSLTMLGNATVFPFRSSSGDESSCLNLYAPRRPTLLGATEAMISRGGFKFKSSLAQTEEEKKNPWTLLNRRFADDAVPAIGDYNTVMWLLHLGLDKDLTITDEWGNNFKLRIVAMLSGSLLQGGLIIAESRFIELFPSVSGYSFFLIESSRDITDGQSAALESDLENYGFDLTAAIDRLNEYLTIEHAYLSTFQTLGGLGVVLGTFGLAAVMLRNVLERRRELALMRALGYRNLDIGWLLLAENIALLLSGLSTGLLSALLAVAPHVRLNYSTISWGSLALMLVLVLLTGTITGIVALIPTLRSPLLPALRAE